VIFQQIKQHLIFHNRWLGDFFFLGLFGKALISQPGIAALRPPSIGLVDETAGGRCLFWLEKIRLNV